MDSNISNQETRQFKMHNNLINTIIFKQAGSFEKAFAELIMNSIDANSTKIDIDYDKDKNTFVLTDDGKGFTTEKEIESFFDTLGTPHKDDDAKFGRFRIGRTQIFAYASTVWRSGTFKMSVDFLNNQDGDLSYRLEKNLPFHKGCSIYGTVYKRTNADGRPTRIGDVIDEVLDYHFPYSDIPIYVNSELVVKENKLIEWDMETETAYYKFNGYRGAYIYNMGAFVKKYDGSYFGIGVDVVTKKALDVNFARNDIISYGCEIFRSISFEIREYVNTRVIKKSKLTIDEKEYFFNQFLNNQIPYNDVRILKIFTDVFERDFSLEDFVRARRVSYSSGNSGKLAEMVHESKMALVFNRDFAIIGRDDSFENFINRIWNNYAFLCKAYKKENPSYYNLREDYRKLNGQELKEDINYFKESFSTQHKILEKSELSEKDNLLLKSIRRLNDIFYENYRPIIKCKKRKIVFGESLASLGWTDGVSYIAINKDLIPIVNNGMSFFDYILKIIIHEYCHNNFTTNEHPHDGEFYKMYHDITIQGGFSQFKNELIKNISNFSKRAAFTYYSNLKNNGLSAPKKLEFEMSHHKENSDNYIVKNLLTDFAKIRYKEVSPDVYKGELLKESLQEKIQRILLKEKSVSLFIGRYIFVKSKITLAINMYLQLEESTDLQMDIFLVDIDKFVDFIIATHYGIFRGSTISSIIKNLKKSYELYKENKEDTDIQKELQKEFNEPFDYRKALKFYYYFKKREWFFIKGLSFCIVNDETYKRIEKEKKEGQGFSNVELLSQEYITDKLIEKLEEIKQKFIAYNEAEERKDYDTRSIIYDSCNNILEDKCFITTQSNYDNIFSSLGYTEHLKCFRLIQKFEYSVDNGYSI